MAVFLLLKTIKSDFLSCLGSFINDPAQKMESLREQLSLCAISNDIFSSKLQLICL